jgi:glutamate/tyrosine decarboxylase-like PLP-dependent enzyme
MNYGSIEEAQKLVREAISRQTQPANVLPDSAALKHAQEKILSHLPAQGLGLTDTIQHLTNDLIPSFNASSRSSNYYGFVTGGSTPAASLADNIVTAFDQNLSVHRPSDGTGTVIEDGALSMLCELLHMKPEEWPHRLFTTGATASNVLGLACGRDFVISGTAVANGAPQPYTAAELGLPDALRNLGVDKIQILATVPHSSLVKAASLVGLGRASVKLVGMESEPHKFDMVKLERDLGSSRVLSIVSVSCGEINTGFYATGHQDMKKIRELCDKHHAWLHVDGGKPQLQRLHLSASSC